MALCRECGINYIGPKGFCPKCYLAFKKRKQFRKIMDELSKIAELSEYDSKHMTGFSYAEQERFSLIFRKIQKRFHFPLDFEDFVNHSAIKEAEQLYLTEYSQKLDKVLSSNDKTVLYKIKHKLEAKHSDGGWDKSSLSDILCFCLNKGTHALECKEEISTDKKMKITSYRICESQNNKKTKKEIIALVEARMEMNDIDEAAAILTDFLIMLGYFELKDNGFYTTQKWDNMAPDIFLKLWNECFKEFVRV